VLPKAPPPRISNPRTRPKYIPSNSNWGRDSARLNTQYSYGGHHYYYSDPYGPSYFGSYNSSMNYLWLYLWLDNDRSNNEPPPESTDKVDTSILSYMQVIQAMQELSAGKSS
jgi:hypothetical protein